MLAEATWYRFKVLIIGAQQLVRDNISVLLRTMGGWCVISSSLKEAPALLEKERPDAAILDQQLLESRPAEILAALHRLFIKLQGRTVLLTRENSDPQSLKVLDAYSIPKIPADLVFQELWPCLDSLLRRNIAPSMQDARLVFDSLFQPLPAGIRSTQPTERSLLYEAGDVTVDLWLEPDRDSHRVRLMGQIVDQAKRASAKPCYPIVLQSKAEPIAAATSNALGEFQLEFGPHPPMKLEIGVRERHWVSLELPEFSSTPQEIQD
jgi:DNA-binding response OmpR family regulator